MAILVTGGAGYIGSHTCIELLKSGYEVIIVDNFVNSKPKVLDRIREIAEKDFKFYETDLLNKKDLEKVFVENDITAVIHFAGLKAVGESVQIPLRYYHNNITGTLNLCELMQKFKVHKMVFSSSATVYGNPQSVPIKEHFPLSTTNPYGATKLMIEQILTDLYNSDKSFNIALLRYFNPIGAHESGLIGEDPNGIPNNLLPYIAGVAIGKLPELYVYGKDYDTKDGTGVRDYIHVVDLALGHIKALEKLDKTIDMGVVPYNLGTGIGYSVLDMIKAFEDANNVTIKYTIAKRRAGDIAECYADPEFSAKELDWKAKFDVKKMCEDAWRFIKNNQDGI